MGVEPPFAPRLPPGKGFKNGIGGLNPVGRPEKPSLEWKAPPGKPGPAPVNLITRVPLKKG